jgi:YD repeat-containing protein
MNADGLITKRNFPAPLGTSTVSYYPDGKVNTATDELGVKTVYTYNSDGSVSSVTRDSTGSLAVRFDYTYDTSFPEKVTSIMPKKSNHRPSGPDCYYWGWLLRAL